MIKIIFRSTIFRGTTFLWLNFWSVTFLEYKNFRSQKFWGVKMFSWNFFGGLKFLEDQYFLNSQTFKEGNNLMIFNKSVSHFWVVKISNGLKYWPQNMVTQKMCRSQKKLTTKNVNFPEFGPLKSFYPINIDFLNILNHLFMLTPWNILSQPKTLNQQKYWPSQKFKTPQTIWLS